MPDSADNNALALHAVQNDVRSVSDDELSDSRLSPGSAQVGMIPESFDHGDNPHGEPFRCLRFITSNVIADFPQAGPRQRRPDNFYWHSASSSCVLPQTHFGTGNSRSVPQDKSHAFMSSFLM